MTFHVLSTPPPPLPTKAGRFLQKVFGSYLQRSQQNLDPSDQFRKGADNARTLLNSFLERHQQKFEGQIPVIFAIRAGFYFKFIYC